MPGKVNPVIPEVVNMVCFRVIGSDLTVTMAAEGGQLQLNVFEPVIAACIFEAQTMFVNAARTLREHCVDGITANADVCQHYVEYSIGTVTALNPVIGYDTVDRARRRGAEDRPRHPRARPREADPHRGADRRGARSGRDDRDRTAASDPVGPPARVDRARGIADRGSCVARAMLVESVARRPDASGVASVRDLRRDDLVGRDRRVADSDRVGARRRGRGSHGHAPAADAYAGFANGTILLIVVAFLVARAVVKCGLGARSDIAIDQLVRHDRRSGCRTAIFLLDALIAPAFPSNTARSGVLYPLAFSLAEAAGARPERQDRKRLGAFLMFSGIASLSAVLGAVADGDGRPIRSAPRSRKKFGVEIGFGSWLLAASVPTLCAMVARTVPALQDHQAGSDGDARAPAAARQGARRARAADA